MASTAWIWFCFNVCKLWIGNQIVHYIVHPLYTGNLIQIILRPNLRARLYSTHKNWTTGVDINVLMEQTIIMSQGSSKETSRHKKLMEAANEFFHSSAEKLSRKSKNSCMETTLQKKKQGFHIKFLVVSVKDPLNNIFFLGLSIHIYLVTTYLRNYKSKWHRICMVIVCYMV